MHSIGLQGGEQEIEEAKAVVLKGLDRYPLVSQRLLRVVAQVPRLKQATKLLQEEINPETGLPYLTDVPVSFGETGAPRVYRSEYREILEPFFHPSRMGGLYIMNANARVQEQQRVVRALSTYPLLNPSLMQSALNFTSTYFKPDLEFLIKEHIVVIWHPSLPQDIIREDVTTRGVRYLLAKYEERLRSFLVR